MAASLGFEPRQRDPESLVLPLHHEAIERKGNAETAFLSSYAQVGAIDLNRPHPIFAVTQTAVRVNRPALTANDDS